MAQLPAATRHDLSGQGSKSQIVSKNAANPYEAPNPTFNPIYHQIAQNKMPKSQSYIPEHDRYQPEVLELAF